MSKSIWLALLLLLAMVAHAVAHPAPPCEVSVSFLKNGYYQLLIKGDTAALVMQATPGHLTSEQVEALQSISDADLAGWIDDAHKMLSEKIIVEFDGQKQLTLEITFPSQQQLRIAQVHATVARKDEIIITGLIPAGAQTFAFALPAALGHGEVWQQGRGPLQTFAPGVLIEPLSIVESSAPPVASEQTSLVSIGGILLVFFMIVVLFARSRPVALSSLLFATIFCMANSVQADSQESLATYEQLQLTRYLEVLSRGGTASAQQVDQLADIGFDGLQTILKTYTNLKEPVAPATNRAFLALMERTSRTALDPWPMIQLYSPDFANFLIQSAKDNEANQTLAKNLFIQLTSSEDTRLACDLAVRLTPELSLKYLADRQSPHRLPMLEAWNRRLSRGKESRPIANLESLVASIAQATTVKDLSASEAVEQLEAELRFMAAWSTEKALYASFLRDCLTGSNPQLVLAGLKAQRHFPQLLDLNAALVMKFADHPKILELALENYAFDESHDHAESLHKLWPQLAKAHGKARYNCLLAMGVHPQGNDTLALAAVKEAPFTFIDVALPVLVQGDRELARQAVAYMFENSDRGLEEALRLAKGQQLTEFFPQAIKLALDPKADQVLRQAAISYLQLADGKQRAQILPLLTDINPDIRLSAIQCFGESKNLAADDKNQIGPALIGVALNDASTGHRQEAMYAIGRWQEPLTREFFQKILVDYPPIVIVAGHYNDSLYWQYRIRLVALLGLARLGDEAAKQELLKMHKHGGPVERMDVLLVFLELKEVPPGAFDDLKSPEPKLIVTAAKLISTVGTAAEQEQLRQIFAKAPVWKLFKNAGIDDHLILSTVGLTPTKPTLSEKVNVPKP